MDIKRISSPNFTKGRGGEKVKAIVLHITQVDFDNSLGSRLGWMTNTKSQVSSHYLVGDRQPYIIQLVSEEDTAWHAGRVVNPTGKGITDKNPNLYTIGIEVALINSGIKPKFFQWLQTARLVKDICERYNLPLDTEHIIGHKEIRADKECPGKYITPTWIIWLIKYVVPHFKNIVL